MLILVAVTVTITKEGGLFTTARTAKQGTAYSAEEETLLTYIYGDGVYDAKTGEVNLTALKELLTDTTKWQSPTLDNDTTPTTLTVTGVQSGEEHIINTDGTMGEKKSDTSVGIVGTYYTNFFDEVAYVQFNEDKSIKFMKFDSQTSDFENMGEPTSTYTYSSENKKGILTLVFDYDGSNFTETYNFDYEIVTNENSDVINEVLFFEDSILPTCVAKKHNEGLIPLTGNVYANGNKTIEFSKSTEDGIAYGLCIIKEDGAIMNSGEADYICLNGKIISNNMYLKNCEITVDSDCSVLTVTKDGSSTVYTKQ